MKRIDSARLREICGENREIWRETERECAENRERYGVTWRDMKRKGEKGREMERQTAISLV